MAHTVLLLVATIFRCYISSKIIIKFFYLFFSQKTASFANVANVLSTNGIQLTLQLFPEILIATKKNLINYIVLFFCITEFLL